MANKKNMPGGNTLNGNYKILPGNEIYIDYEIEEDDREVESDSYLDNECDLDEKTEICPKDFFNAIKRFKGRLVTVEFVCDGCCKKATGILKCIGHDFVLLVRPPKKLVHVQMFCHTVKGPVVECACEVVIQFKNIISVELSANQNCPKKK